MDGQTTHYLYRLFDGDNRLLYVGLTEQLPNRLGAHIGGPWGHEIRSATFVPHTAREQAQRREAAAIAAEAPAYNVQHQADLSAARSRRRAAQPPHRCPAPPPLRLRANGVFLLAIMDLSGLDVAKVAAASGLGEAGVRAIIAGDRVPYGDAERLSHALGIVPAAAFPELCGFVRAVAEPAGEVAR